MPPGQPEPGSHAGFPETGLVGPRLYPGASTSAAWSGVANLGPGVNSTANDLRPSLSWDGTALYFGSTRAGGEGVQDLFVTTRSKVIGP